MDSELLALSPHSPPESFALMIRAFNLSETQRVPVFFMMDEVVGDMTERVAIPPAEDIAVVPRRWTKKAPGCGYNGNTTITLITGDAAAQSRGVHALMRAQEETVIQPLLDYLAARNDLRLIGPRKAALRAPTVAVELRAPALVMLPQPAGATRAIRGSERRGGTGVVPRLVCAGSSADAKVNGAGTVVMRHLPQRQRRLRTEMPET